MCRQIQDTGRDGVQRRHSLIDESLEMVDNIKGVVTLTVQDAGYYGYYYRYHAVIIVEYIFDTNPQTYIYDFVPPDPRRGHPDSAVRMNRAEPQDLMSRDFFAQKFSLNLHYYSSWEVPMRDLLILEEDMQGQLPESTRPSNVSPIRPPSFCMSGSYLAQTREDLRTTPRGGTPPETSQWCVAQNCISWAQSELTFFGGIRRQEVSKNTGWDRIAIMPTSHINHHP